jgi:drug/metabolite transporter (DMT)-like permease
MTNLFGGLVALISAVVWGTSDFTGGLAARNRNQYQVLALTTLAGMASLMAAILIRSERLPAPVSILWSCAAGISGAIGIAALYRGLAIAQAALVAPTAAVVSVIPPVVVGSILYGPPGAWKWVGMAAGVVGIWLGTKGTGSSRETNGLGLSILAGFGFGGFFLCIVQTDPVNVFFPLIIAKMAGFIFAICVLIFQRSKLPAFKGNGLALLAGFLDAGGNVFFLLAARLTRIEFATVISSMAPLMTVILASFISRQKASTVQKLGVGFCLIAIALILA